MAKHGPLSPALRVLAISGSQMTIILLPWYCFWVVKIKEYNKSVLLMFKARLAHLTHVTMRTPVPSPWPEVQQYTGHPMWPSIILYLLTTCLSFCAYPICTKTCTMALSGRYWHSICPLAFSLMTTFQILNHLSQCMDIYIVHVCKISTVKTCFC